MQDLAASRQRFWGESGARVWGYCLEWLAARGAPSVPRPLKILFPTGSRWESELCRSFARTRHQLSFAALSLENVLAHDLVVPLEDPQNMVDLHRWRPYLHKQPLPLPGQASVVLCNDKLRCWETLWAHGFGAYLPDVSWKLAPPYVIKPRIGYGGADCHVVTQAELPEALKPLLKHRDYYCQQAVLGAYQQAAHILFRGGHIVYMRTVVHHYDRTLAVQGQYSASLSRLGLNRYQEIFTDMLRALGFEGLCCIDYKATPEGPQVLEINPRLGGGMVRYLPNMLRHLDWDDLRAPSVPSAS